MIGAVNPYWGLLHCVHTLTVLLLAERGQAIEPMGRDAAGVTSIGTLALFYTHSQCSYNHLKGP